MRTIVTVAAVAVLWTTGATQTREPILDMHLHALAADDQGPPPVALCSPIQAMPVWDVRQPYPAAFVAQLKDCANPLQSPTSDEALMNETLEIMQRRNIVGVLSGPADRIDAWVARAPGRFIRGLRFRLDRDAALTPDVLRRMHAAGRLEVLGEVTNQYAGIAPGDARMEPYWALAEELELPVGIHIGPGPPGVVYLDSPAYRARLHSALTLEDALVRHPRLRVYIMHAGYPLLDDLLALLYAHPQVYVDVGVIAFTQPRPAFYRFLQGIADGGFGRRVMFGSDQMVWPAAIERALAAIEEAPFLTPEQRRDILYDNAARFLRLSPEVTARHRAM